MDHASKQNLLPLFCFIFILNFIMCGVRSSVDELKHIYITMDLKARTSLVGLQNSRATMTMPLKKGYLMCHTQQPYISQPFLERGVTLWPEFWPVECGKKHWMLHSSLVWCKFLLCNLLLMFFLHLLAGQGGLRRGLWVMGVTEPQDEGSLKCHVEGHWQTSILTCYVIQK